MPNETPPLTNFGDLAGEEGPVPKFACRRPARAARQVITDDVDAEKYARAEGDVANYKDVAARAESEKFDSKDEPRARLNALATFAVCGFGRFNATLSIGAYNKERKAPHHRQ